MLRRAIVTRQLSAARQRATSDATLVFGNDNDDDIDMANRDHDADNRRRENYHNYSVRHLSENERTAQQEGGAAEFTANSRRRNQMSAEATAAALVRYNERRQAEVERHGQNAPHNHEAGEVPTKTGTRDAPRQEREPRVGHRESQRNTTIERRADEILRGARLPRANEENNGGWTREQLESQPLPQASISMRIANEAPRAPPSQERNDHIEEEERRLGEEAEDISIEDGISASRRGATPKSINALESQGATREEAEYVDDVYDASQNAVCQICQLQLQEGEEMLIMPCRSAR